MREKEPTPVASVDDIALLPVAFTWRQLTLQELEAGIRSLQARIEELGELGSMGSSSTGGAVEAVKQAFLHNMLELYGGESARYRHFEREPIIDEKQWLTVQTVLGESREDRQRRMDDVFQEMVRYAVQTVAEEARLLECERQDLLDRTRRTLESVTETATRLTRIFDSFHGVAQRLRVRDRERRPVTLDDEYDVQYVLRALLAVDFADVRPEEPTPSHAGGSARADFLLKNERVVVETKMTRPGLTDRKVGHELTIDIARYRAHSDCDALYCFVYDPEHRLGNPAALEKDLEGSAPGFVRVFVRPKR